MSETGKAKIPATKVEEDRTRAAILATLDKLGSITTQTDTLTFEGDRFVIPASMGDVQSAIDFLEEFQESQETRYRYTRIFPYRPYDGMAAFDRAVKRVTGSAGIGRPTFTMFGVNPPDLVTINVGPHGQTIQVPAGQVEVPILEATFHLAGTMKDGDLVFAVSVEAPRKHKARVAAFLDVVADELATRSIYRGHAITANAEEPTFLDLSTLDPDTVVYGQATLTQLQANVWTLIEHPAEMRALGIPLKRAILVEGPYGTGKTLAGQLTGQRALKHGWTYILARPGVDDLASVMTLARQYAPAVVWMEDIDTVRGGSAEYLSRLLETFDGVTAKGHEVLVGLTTNHVERIPRGMLRPGRIDTVIHIGPLDLPAVRQLVETTVSADMLAPGIDWNRVAGAFLTPDPYVPAFGREAISRAIRYAMARNNGQVTPIDTDDLVNAAEGLREQHRLMEAADEGVRDADTPIEASIRRLITEANEEVTVRTSIAENYDHNMVVHSPSK